MAKKSTSRNSTSPQKPENSLLDEIKSLKEEREKLIKKTEELEQVARYLAASFLLIEERYGAILKDKKPSLLDLIRKFRAILEFLVFIADTIQAFRKNVVVQTDKPITENAA